MTRGGEIGGVRAGEPHPADAAHRTDRPQQVGEIVLAVVVRVDGLAQERDFAGALLRHLLHFPHHVRQAPASLGAAGVRDDAEGATVVAAPLYRDETGRTLFPHRRDVFVVLPGAELGVGHPLSRLRQPDQLAEVAVRVGPDHQVDPRHLLQQPRAQPLRHAAHHAEHAAGAFVPLQLAHPADHPLLGVVPDRAGVHQHDVRLGGMLGAHVALAPQHAEHQLGVGDVHLAAVGLDVEPLSHAGKIAAGGSRGRPASGTDADADRDDQRRAP